MLLEMKAISKSFPGVRALSNVDIALDGGEVLGIVGENGAGKSTLMKVLAGGIHADAGEMKLDGEAFAPRRPRDALDVGIVVIHQELSLVPDRSISENLYLGNLPARLGLIDRRAMDRRATALLAKVGLKISPRRLVRRLGIAQQQLVEIARALSREAKLIVMDEPTATLTTAEQRTLFATVAELKAAGVAIIFISHHLEEVFEICDRVTVMRDGHVVETRPTGEWNEAELIRAMVNRPIESMFPSRNVKVGKTLLEVSNLSSAGRFSDVSFSVRSGEVVGIGGLIGAGRTEVLKAIYGALPSVGEIRIDDRPVHVATPRQAISAGIALVPEDRKAEGLILPFSVGRNIALSVLSRLAAFGAFLRGRRMDVVARHAVEEMRIRTPGIDVAVSNLSGGNQQKVVLGRALSTEPRVFLLDEPTRGIDVGAKVEIYRLIGELAGRGGAVLVVSSDMVELLGLCDRILVMRTGRLAGSLERSEFNQERVMELAALA
jgi:ABC-type sugar transport system ATPase subunit